MEPPCVGCYSSISWLPRSLLAALVVAARGYFQIDPLGLPLMNLHPTIGKLMKNRVLFSIVFATDVIFLVACVASGQVADAPDGTVAGIPANYTLADTEPSRPIGISISSSSNSI
jgi:hypothetical protein